MKKNCIRIFQGKLLFSLLLMFSYASSLWGKDNIGPAPDSTFLLLHEAVIAASFPNQWGGGSMEAYKVSFGFPKNSKKIGWAIDLLAGFRQVTYFSQSTFGALEWSTKARTYVGNLASSYLSLAVGPTFSYWRELVPQYTEMNFAFGIGTHLEFSTRSYNTALVIGYDVYLGGDSFLNQLIFGFVIPLNYWRG